MAIPVNVNLSHDANTFTLDAASQTLSLGAEAQVRNKAGKTAADMIDLLYCRTLPYYDFYVGLTNTADKHIFEETGLRYDLIIVQPGCLGGEFTKTSGHEHFGLYPEIYEVHHGTALFLLQKGDGPSLDFFAAVKATKGEKNSCSSRIFALHCQHRLRIARFRRPGLRQMPKQLRDSAKLSWHGILCAERRRYAPFCS